MVPEVLENTRELTLSVNIIGTSGEFVLSTPPKADIILSLISSALGEGKAAAPFLKLHIVSKDAALSSPLVIEYILHRGRIPAA